MNHRTGLFALWDLHRMRVSLFLYSYGQFD